MKHPQNNWFPADIGTEKIHNASWSRCRSDNLLEKIYSDVATPAVNLPTTMMNPS